jgi:autotransporter-associated beta strand protein
MGPFGPLARAQFYFDTNGTTAGSGIVSGGNYTWSTAVANWASGNATGLAATAVWTNGSLANFAATTDAAGVAYNVSLGTSVTASGLTVDDGLVAIATGANTLTLSANGNFTVASGQSLSLSGSLNLNNGGGTRTLTANLTGNATITANISTSSGTGNITKIGTGTLTLSGNNTYTGNTLVSAGTLRATTNANALGSGNLVLGGGTVQLAADTGLSFNRNTFLTASSNITSDRLTSGVGVNHTLGTLRLGAVTLNATAGPNVTSGTAGITFGTTTLTGSATINTSANTQVTLGAVGGAFTLTKNGTGTLVLNTTSTRTTTAGNTTVTAGTLQLGTAQALNTATANLNLNGGTVLLRPTSDLATTFSGTNTVLGTSAAATITSDRNTSGAGLTHTLGTLRLGSASQLTVNAGSNVASGTAGVTFGTTTLVGSATLNVTGTNAQVTLGAVGGAFTLTKNGTGTLVLNTTSTRTTTAGNTTVTAGTLQLGTAQALNTATANLNLNGGTVLLRPTSDLATTFSGTNTVLGTSAAAVITSDRNTSGAGLTHTLGTLRLGSASQLTVNAGSNVASGTAGVTFGTTTLVGNATLNVTGANAQVTLGALGGAFTLTKNGTGTLTLNTTSTRTTAAGATVLNDGTLQLGTAAALNTAAANLTLNGGTLLLRPTSDLATTFTGANTILAGNATIVSDRNTSGAGLTHILGNLSVGASTLTLNGGSNVASGTAGVTFGNTTTTGNATFNVGSGALLTLGALNDGGSADVLTKSGLGTLTLSANATSLVNGTALSITAGNVNVNAATALGTLANVSVSSGATLGLGANQTLGGLSGTGSVTLGSNTLTIGNASNNLSTTFGGNITGTGNLVKAGTGTLTLSSNNSFTGTTNITAGTLATTATNALSTSNVTVGTGGTLQLSTTNFTLSNNITLAGGTLQSITGNATQFAGNINLTAASDIVSSTAGQNLIVGTFTGNGITSTINLASSNLTLSGAGNIEFWGNVGVSGNTGNLISNSTGTVRFYGYTNFYTGNTIINSGNLIIDTDPNTIFNDQVIRGNLTIGDGTNAALVRYANGNLDNKIGDNSTITINYGSRLDLNDAFDYVGGLNLTGANITTGSGGTLLLTGNVVTNAANLTTTISGYQFAMGANNTVNRTFTVADGSAASDLTINSQVAFGALYKLGTGTMTLTGNNIYGGLTTVAAGVLNIQNNTALGATANGTVVLSGAELQMQGGLAVAGETLNLSGNGTSGSGAFRSMSGNNSWSGAITLAAASRINSETAGDNLTITAGISGTNQNLTVGGAGDMFLHGPIGTGNGTLTKDGTGTVTITNSNTYQGVTNINAGVVNIRNDYALGSTAGNVVVANGAALQIQQDAAYNGGNAISVGAETLFLSGNGISNTGALRNLNGDNRWGGNITVGSANTRINSDSGTLNLTATTTNIAVALGSNTLTVGGAGNTRIGSNLTSGTAGQLVKDGAGTLTLAGNGTAFTGTVNVTAGTTRFGANNALNNASSSLTITGNSSIIDFANYQQTIGNLTSGVGNTTTLLQFGANSSVTLASGLSVLGGNWTFTGNVAAGESGKLVVGSGTTLRLASSNQTALGLNIELAGGTLEVNGTAWNSFGNLTVTGNSIIDFSGGTQSLISFTNVFLSSYQLSVSGWNDELDFFLSTGDPGTKGASPLNLITFAPSGPWVGNDTIWTGDYLGSGWRRDDEIRPFKVIPEPSTYGAMILGAGLALFGYRRWRQLRATPPPAAPQR